MAANDESNEEALETTISLVEWVGAAERSTCGYCKGNRVAHRSSFGIWAHRLSPTAYQRLCDAGWRRSGKYVYRPMNDRTCCPQYTIKLDVLEYRLSRSHRRVMKEVERWLEKDEKPSRNVHPTKSSTASLSASSSAPLTSAHSRILASGSKEAPKEKVEPKHVWTEEEQKARDERRRNKKKYQRKERCFQRLRDKGIDVEQYKADFRARIEARRGRIRRPPQDSNWKHTLDWLLISPRHPQYESVWATESFALYEKYQREVHNDETTRRSWEGFLCGTPMGYLPCGEPLAAAVAHTAPEGTYHWLWLIDGKMVAVSVLDVLPAAVSSKYFYYDPAFSFLSLGVYSALMEIELIQRIARDRPRLHHYYMGYYISTCAKMRYKAQFRPSQLLCDQSLEWVPLDEAERLLAENDGRYVAFRPEKPRPDPAEPRANQLVWYGMQICSYGRLAARTRRTETEEWRRRVDEFRMWAHRAAPITAINLRVVPNDDAEDDQEEDEDAGDDAQQDTGESEDEEMRDATADE